MAAFRVVGLIVALLAAAPAAAAPSDIDTSFGAGGVIGGGGPPFSAVAALQPDGKLIVAESQGSAPNASWLIRRYTADGSSDLSFGTNSSVTVSFGVIFPADGNAGNDYPSGIALLVDGRFVVAGKSIGGCFPGDACESALVVARFNADGSLDVSFGNGGKVVVFGPGADAFGIQPDGRLLILSDLSSLIGGLRTPMLRRFNGDGSPDAAFVPTIPCVGNGTIRVDQDGRTVVATSALDPGNPGSTVFCTARLNGDGTLDTAFGMQGMTSVATGASRLADFFIDASGGIVVAGSGAAGVLFRLTPDGSLDTHFGNGGMVSVDPVDSIAVIAGDCHDRILVAAVRFDSVFNRSEAFFARLLPSGSVDPAFTTASDGFATTGLSDVGQMLVKPNGRIIALGINGGSVAVPPQFQIIQYLGDLPCATTTAVEYYYAAWNYYLETAFPDEIAALDGGAFGGAWRRTGETFNVWPQPNASASQTCRFFSTAFAPKSSHFYTPFPAECAIVKANPSWQFESIAFYIQIPTGYGTGNGSCPQGTTALYRAYNNGMGGAPNHRYTTSLAILNTMLAQGWVFEGEANTKVFACVPQ